MKILVQLEIEYEQPANKTYFWDLIDLIKTYFENEITIPETEKVNFKEYDIVKISQRLK
jgi:hypothetical protein